MPTNKNCRQEEGKWDNKRKKTEVPFVNIWNFEPNEQTILKMGPKHVLTKGRDLKVLIQLMWYNKTDNTRKTNRCNKDIGQEFKRS